MVGVQQDGKVDKRNKDVKRSEGEIAGGFLFRESCSCFHLPTTPFSSLTLPPTEASLKVSRL